MKQLDRTDRLVLVLTSESRRMREAAERVDLVVRAVALSRGVRYPEPTERHEAAAD
jgi:hypothetical protein